MTIRQLTILQSLALITLVLVGYYQVKDHHFLWDTIPFVLENPWVHEWTIDNIRAMFTQAHRANWHPVVLLSHALDFSLFGNDSGRHHLTNLFLHLLNTLLLYGLVYKLLTTASTIKIESLWIAFLTALIFAIHPQHVESVAWVAERKDVLYSLFYLSCLWSYLNLVTLNKSHRHLLVPFLLFCISIGAKPMAVTLPVVLIMFDIFPLRRVTTLKNLIHCCLEKSHYFIVSMIVALVTLATQTEAMPGMENLPAWVRVLNAIDNCWFYLAHYLWPINLSPFYPYPQDISYLASPDFWLQGVIFLVLSVGLSTWLYFRGSVWPGLLVAFYLITLLPVSGLIHVGPAKATDHYVYLATVPWSLLTAIIIVKAWTSIPRIRVVVLPITFAYLTFLLSITHLQVGYWNNPLSLWGRVITLYPASPFGHRNLASGYAHIEQWDLALEHGELSLKLGSPDAEYVVRLREKVQQLKTDETEAVDGDH